MKSIQELIDFYQGLVDSGKGSDLDLATLIYLGSYKVIRKGLIKLGRALKVGELD